MASDMAEALYTGFTRASTAARPIGGLWFGLACQRIFGYTQEVTAGLALPLPFTASV